MDLFECEEYLIAPSDVVKARSLLVDERTLYNIIDVARSVLTGYEVRNTNGINVDIEQIVGSDDPFLCIAPSVTKAIFSADLPLRKDHCQHIVDRCSYFKSSLLSLDHMKVKKRCSDLSVFAGRNPLVSIY